MLSLDIDTQRWCFVQVQYAKAFKKIQRKRSFVFIRPRVFFISLQITEIKALLVTF